MKNKFLNASVYNLIYISQGQGATWQFSHTNFWSGILCWILALFFIPLTRSLPNYPFMLFFVDIVFKNKFKHEGLSPVFKGCSISFSSLFPWGIPSIFEVNCRRLFCLHVKAIQEIDLMGIEMIPAMLFKALGGICFNAFI